MLDKNAILRTSLMKAACVIVAVITLLGFGIESVNASEKQIKGNTYDIIKNGNNVYCTAGNRIYRVNYKTKKKTLVKKMKKATNLSSMFKKKNYLYFIDINQKTFNTPLYRIDLKSKKIKKLAEDVYEYCVKGNYVYYLSSDSGDEGDLYYRMSLSGKGKELVDREVVCCCNDTNKAARRVGLKYIDRRPNYGSKTTRFLYSKKLGKIKLARFW